ncbi:MAG: hypothetical protein ABJB40_00250 [Acidobacteriota bacterium]
MDSSSRNTAIHGVLLNIFSTGVVLTGESGRGKSDCALELLSRGHKLIADDVVEVTRICDRLIGRSPVRFVGLLDVRDIGIVDVRALFPDGFKLEHEIDLCIDLQDHDEGQSLERPGNKVSETDIADFVVPKFVLSITRGRNLPLLVETIVRLYESGNLPAETELLVAHDDLVADPPNNLR